MRFWVLLLIILCGGSAVMAQDNPVILDYIRTYRQLAVDEMIRTGVPASIKLAQGIHETEAGQSDLVSRSNNHFGIKCKTGWQGNKVYHDDDARGECFRSYDKAEDSYSDHSNFLRGNQRYAFLFDLDPTDYKSWAFGLKKAGYATNIKYSQILIKLIEDYNLQQYSLIALGRMAPPEDMLVSGTTTNQPAGTGPAAPVAPIMEETAPLPDYPSGTFLINNTKVVFAPAGTVLLSIAQKYDVPLARIYEFNELDQEEVLLEPQLIFLQRKRKKGSVAFHTVKSGESLRRISQTQGIRLENLLEYNSLNADDQPKPGSVLYLQENATQAPELLNAPTASSTRSTVSVPSKENTKIFHSVAVKETLYSISKKYNVTVEQIKDWNGLRGNDLRSGQKLLIYKN